jgi:hypothetical protein
MAAQNYSVRDALALCGVENTILYGGLTAADRMADGLFSHDFTECMDKSMKDLQSDFEAFSQLPANQGRIRLLPSTTKRIKAFMQWTRDMIRTGRDPSTLAFPVADTTALTRRLVTHELFVKESTSIDAIKPKMFKNDVKWPDWKPTLVNYLHKIPGRDGVPLSYIIRAHDAPDLTPHVDFLEEYVASALLTGDAYRIDSARVATIIQSLIVGNTHAETKIQTITSAHSDGRSMFQALDAYYLGVGIFALETTEAERVLDQLFYQGEKQPYMWWDEFERQLTHAYATIDKKEGRQVYSNGMKLRTLCQKLKADFLAPQLASINTELAKQPMTYTFDNALAAVRNVVAQKFPTPLANRSHHPRPARHIRSMNSRAGQSPRHPAGRGRGGRGQHTRSTRSHNANGSGTQQVQRTHARRHDVRTTRNDSEVVQLTSGKWLEYHPSFYYSPDTLSDFPDALRTKMRNQRDEYKRQQRNSNTSTGASTSSRQIQELQSQIQSLRDQVSVSTLPPANIVTTTDNQSRVSQVTNATSIMGGRNDHVPRSNPPRWDPHTGQRISKVIISAVRNTEAPSIRPASQAPDHTRADNETDNNADTTVMGKNFALLHHTRRIADVYPFDTNMAPTAVPIATGATLYDHPDGFPILLILHEALWYGNQLDHSLWNPNQLRAFGIPYWDNPFDNAHTLGIDLAPNLHIPLQTKGTKVLFSTRVPTQDELMDPNIMRFDLTSDRDWNPTQIKLSEVNMEDAAPLNPTIAEVIIDFDLVDKPTRKTFVSTERHHRATAEALSERFGIGIMRARKTLEATTQKGTRSAILPLERRYQADRRFEKRRLRGKFSTDTAYFPCKSLRGYIASQIYFDKCGFAACYHIPKADDANIGPTLNAFSTDYGIPDHLTMDGANVQVGRNTQFQQFMRRNDISFHVSHPRRPNENPAEGGIREIKRRFYRYIQKYDIPMRLWDFVLDYTVDVMNVTVNSSRYSNERTPLEIVTGITPDISEYLDFHIYDWVYYKTNAGLGPRELGRWLGVSHRRGPLMTYWILTHNGQIISCDSVQRVTNAEKEADTVKHAMSEYTTVVSPRLNAAAGIIQVQNYGDMLFDIHNEDEAFLQEFNRVIDDPTLPHADNAPPGTFPTEQLAPDPYLNMEVGLRRDPEASPQRAKVKRRKLHEDGTPIGATHPSGNPLLDQRIYEVEFPDGTTEALAANYLAENILAQVDEDGHRQLLIDEITDHRTTGDAIPKARGLIYNQYGVPRKVQTTRGWELYVQWKDGSSSWISLKDLKESFPIELARYARDRQLLDEPAFAWWARHVLKKALTTISKIKSKYWERTHKYGIRIPKSIAEAKRIDAENGNTLWIDSVRQEMGAIRVALEEYDGNVCDLVGYQRITGHIVFDVKLGENFRRKARFCADGHKTQAPASVTYSSVVSRDSVRIMLLIAALNNLALKAADIQNAFLTAPNLEKVYMTAGPEFGPDEGKTYIIRRALYGLKSASAAFRAYLAEKLEDIGFKSSTADPDVWLRPATGPDGTAYYSYVLAYVDDILAIDFKPDDIMTQIGERFKFKNDEVKTPTNYLGARLKDRTYEGVHMWSMSSDNYTDAALKNVEAQLQGTRWKLPTQATTPMSTDYHPELDTTPELDDDERTRFQELIGIVRWATEIGRVDVLHEVSILSQYQASPREGHLQQLLRIFTFWKRSHKITLYFDPRMPRTDFSEFTTNHHDFEAHYRGAREELPHNMPPPRGLPVLITAYVDASHAANQQTRRSHTGYIIFINRAPILWYSKRQNTVEASTFSSEFIALKTCIEAITHLRYKLRMFGIPLCRKPATKDDPEGSDDPAHIYCDNASVVKNSTMVESTLNKKHSSLAYHYVRWNVAAGIISLAWISTKHNLADTFTKTLPAITRDLLFGSWTY